VAELSHYGDHLRACAAEWHFPGGFYLTHVNHLNNEVNQSLYPRTRKLPAVARLILANSHMDDSLLLAN